MTFLLQAYMQEPKKVKSGFYQFEEEGRNLLEGESDEENQDDNIKMIILVTAANLNYLGRSDIWSGDGTFTVGPFLFYQLYTLHAEVHGQIVHLLYSLLPSKSKQCYKFMWEKLKELKIQKGITPNVKAFRSDLEPAPIKTLLSNFVPESISTCFFHLAQEHWRKSTKPRPDGIEHQ